MDDFKRHIRGFRKRGGHRGPRHAGGMGGPCSCCTEADKRIRMRLARHRLADIDRQELIEDPQDVTDYVQETSQIDM